MAIFSRKNKGGAPEWPLLENGEPVAAVLAAATDTRAMETEIVVNKLRAYGIPVVTSLPGEGIVGLVFAGQPRLGVGVYVPETMAEDAAALLGEADETDNTEDEI